MGKQTAGLPSISTYLRSTTRYRQIRTCNLPAIRERSSLFGSVDIEIRTYNSEKKRKPSCCDTPFFVGLLYVSGGKYRFKFTTEVSVVPDVVRYKWKDAKAKLGPEIRDE